MNATAEGQIAQQLRYALGPLDSILAERGVTDLHCNGAGADGVTPIFIKRNGKREKRLVKLTSRQLMQIGQNAAVLGRSQLTERMPFSPGRFPDGQRAQMACEPAVPEGKYALSVRSGFSKSRTPQQLEEMGVFDETEPSETARERAGIREILALKEGRKWRLMIERLYAGGFSGVFAGPVNTGKTTNLLAFYHAVSLLKRILTVQDTEELSDIPQADVVHFLYPKDAVGIAQHTAEGCIEAALRMDMDEIVNGEVKDGAAWALIRAGSSGHAFKTSCHAPSAEGAFHSILRMAKQHPVARSFDTADLLQTLYELIDFVVFSEVVNDTRRVTQIWFDPAAKKGIPQKVKPALEVVR